MEPGVQHTREQDVHGSPPVRAALRGEPGARRSRAVPARGHDRGHDVSVAGGRQVARARHRERAAPAAEAQRAGEAPQLGVERTRLAAAQQRSRPRGRALQQLCDLRGASAVLENPQGLGGTCQLLNCCCWPPEHDAAVFWVQPH